MYLYLHRCALIASLCLITLGGCASKTTRAPEAPAIQALPQAEIQTTQSFDSGTLYTLITAELALARERYELGLQNYLQEARTTNDINIIARAAQVARILVRHPEALEMAELWHTLNPGSQEARYILIAEYIHFERFTEAFEEAKEMLAAGHQAGFEDIAIEALQKNYEGLKTLSSLFGELLTQYPQSTELLIGKSILLQKEKKLDEALLVIQQALTLDQKNTRANYQLFRILSELKRDEEALAAYARLIETQPDNPRLRSRYAQMLLRKDPNAALEQFEYLYRQDPQNNGILLSLSLIQLDLSKLEAAKRNFQTLLGRADHKDIANFGLGEIARTQERYADALSHYTQVKSGRRYVDASSKAANIITQLQSFDDAFAFLNRRLETATAPQKEDIYLIQANTLSNAKLNARAQSILDLGIQEFPDSVKLIYSRAMHLATNKETDKAEKDFLKVLSLVPGNAATLNALGYTLLTQTDRIHDAEKYIRKAFKLEPEDPAILDSVGWLAFKMGHLDTALQHLEKAFEQYNDDEVASHLGEVLWLLGNKRRAKKVWRKGFESAPKSQPILNTLRRLNIDLEN